MNDLDGRLTHIAQVLRETGHSDMSTDVKTVRDGYSKSNQRAKSLGHEVTNLKKIVSKNEEKLAKIKKLAAEQAEDEALWFKATTIPEEYLQERLRELHRIIEE